MRTMEFDGGKIAYFDSEDANLLAGFDWQVVTENGVESVVARRLRFKVYMHRLIVGAGEHEIVHHLNGNSLDNRKNNLTVGGRRSRGQRGSSRYRGVAWDSACNKWRAFVYLAEPRRIRYCGRFDDELSAARAHDKAAAELFGEFARLNFEGGDAQAGAAAPEATDLTTVRPREPVTEQATHRLRAEPAGLERP
jgi:AP2 domain